MHSGTRTLVSFYNPRRQTWSDHFQLLGPVIDPLTPVGEVTARILQLNLDKRVIERRLLQALGRYPIGPADTKRRAK